MAPDKHQKLLADESRRPVWRTGGSLCMYVVFFVLAFSMKSILKFLVNIRNSSPEQLNQVD